ncbi:MAG: glutamine synthetase [candidate division Zixibacteria bacterium]|nr:glutamine synthetase [candidate division Zixibacteria bacterium]
MKTREDIIRLIDEENVHYIRLWFTDILGRLKGMSITRRELEDILDNGQGFDGSSVEGYVRIEESDLMAWPDYRTFRIIPWDISGEKVAMMFCDIKNPDDTPYEGDPRYALKRMLKKAKDQGYTFYVGPEMEYFYFSDSEQTAVMDHGGYFDYATIDKGTILRKMACRALEGLKVPVECSHHEVAPSQHEIDLKYQEALVMADFCQLYRMVVKETALQNDVYATFMPKPMFGQNGSGMHVHMSLFEGEKNRFFSPDDEYNLSELAKSFMSGLLHHIKAITLVTNQWVNSYKRLVPGYEAPCYISWGNRNRSSLVRVPMYRVGKEKTTRIELRSPDPACNPYLVFAVILAAGLDGVENKYPLPDPIEQNIFHMTPEEKDQYQIESLPSSLENAVRSFARSDLMREALGDHIFESLIANKIEEWDEYRTHVSRYELDKYLPKL